VASDGLGGIKGETLPIVYRDDWLVAIHKPAGLLVHRSDLDRHETRFAVQLLRDQIGMTVWPVHRLDRGTSGLLLFTLDREIGRFLAASSSGAKWKSATWPWCVAFPPNPGAIDHPLAPLADERAGILPGRAPQPALTRFRRLATVELPHRVDRYPTSRYALLELDPLTGRRHQLRRHMKHIAHPIIGDATHGKGKHNRLFQELFGCRRLLLAALEMRLRHPVSGEPLTLRAPLAGDFADVLRRLGWDGVPIAVPLSPND
jgi:tRNA pseudouridine65 synthase